MIAENLELYYNKKEKFGKYNLKDSCYKCITPNPILCPKNHLFSKQDKNKQIAIMLFVTDKCNLNCSYCWFYNQQFIHGELSVESIQKLFKYFQQNYPEYNLIFACLGGEPTLRPEIIEECCKLSMQYQNQVMVKIFTNGYNDLTPFIHLKQEYENLIFCISQNYICKNLYPELQIDQANIVFTDEDTVINYLNKIKLIKQLGYSTCEILFDQRTKNNNIKLATFFQNGLTLLKKAKIYENDTFHITNFYNIEIKRMLEYNDDQTLMINFFPDEKFYPSHFNKNSPIGDLNSLINFEQYRVWFYESPCYKCNLNSICGNSAIDQSMISDDKMIKFSNICLGHMINGYAISEQKLSGGYNE